MVTEKDIVEVRITDQDMVWANAKLSEGVLRARPFYALKSTEELIAAFKKQIVLHRDFSISSRDDVELAVCEDILLSDRGVTEEQLENIWYGIVMRERHNGLDCSISAHEEHPEWFDLEE